MLSALPVSIHSFDDVAGPALRHQAMLKQVALGIVDAVRADPPRYAEGVRIIALIDDASGEVGVDTLPLPRAHCTRTSDL
ncbi:MAG: hypothetical protein FGM37_04920 [Phycisphaerales bacterium]|nr:hypothetical protein [Phycisphaerales bacterium]